MLHRLCLALALLLAPAHALASAKLYNPAPTPLYDTTGALARGAKAYFYAAGTGTPINVYHDAGLTTPWTYPITAGSNGVLPAIYLPYVDYRVRITTAAGAVIFDQDNIANPAPPAPSSTPANKLFATGQIISTLATATIDGFVRMNGRTIGSAASSATERANDDTEDLFLYLCSNLADSIAPMSGGRGSSCAADWAANKSIVVPSMQGRVLAGVDDMGTTAANVLQVTTTCSATNGSPTITVTSAAGLGRTMYALIDGVAAGQIISISGTTVTLDTNYAGATGAGKTCRLSFFSNAQTAGLSGGNQSASMTVAEMATHSHGTTESPHHHDLNFQNNYAAGGGGGVTGGAPPVGITGDALTNLTINNNGQGLPSSVVQPTRLVAWFIHL